MPRTLDLADQLLNGQVRESVAEWRQAGLSFFDISIRLRSECDVAVSPDTVRRWCLVDPDPEREVV